MLQDKPWPFSAIIRSPDPSDIDLWTTHHYRADHSRRRSYLAAPAEARRVISPARRAELTQIYPAGSGIHVALSADIVGRQIDRFMLSVMDGSGLARELAAQHSR